MENGENRRPWREKKLSWIYFIDQIKKDADFIYDEIDGNVYMFDCETARLSIWSEKWNAFTDVGVKNFLEQAKRVSGDKISEVSKGTRIFYKGIELQSKCVEKDTELLEFIDIKGELERSHINISRRGFTEKGEVYFEQQLYPGLLNSVRTVLRHLEKRAKENTEGNIHAKISRIVKKKCEEIVDGKDISVEALAIKKEELVALLVSVAVLSYFAMRDEWDILEKLDNRCGEKRIWHLIVEDINRILSESGNEKLVEELANLTSFFNIKAYDEKRKEHIERGFRDNRFNFTQIFLNNYHWAVIQIRRDFSKSWFSYLILLNGEEEGGFHKLISLPRTKKEENELEEWGKKICNTLGFVNDIGNSEQQFILNWMLKNIPTIGIFSNESGNIRVNVLYNRIYPSIYMNKNFKCLIVKRVLERAKKDGILRFSTITWQNREYISCVELPFAIYFIKRGYLSSNSYYKSIIPFDGELLQRWASILEEGEFLELKKKIEVLWDGMNVRQYFSKLSRDDGKDTEDIRQFLQNSDTDEVYFLITEIFDVILDKIADNGFKPKETFDSLLEPDEERVASWEKLYHDFARVHLLEMKADNQEEFETKQEIQSLMKSIKDNPGLSSLCSAWLYFSLYREDVFASKSEVRKFHKKYLEEHPEAKQKEEKMLQYLKSRLRYDVMEESIRENVTAYKEEWIDLIIELETRPVRQFQEERVNRERYFTSRLKAGYSEWLNTQASVKEEYKREDG